MARKFNLNSRTVAAPIAAFCMASILFVYTRTSIQAAKRNAQKHREADGGQISWRNESLRRHGVLEPPEEQGAVRQLLLGGKGGKTAEPSEAVKSAVVGPTEEEVRIRTLAAEKERGRGGS